MRVLVRVVLLGSLLTTFTPLRALAQPASAADRAHVAKQYVDAGLAAQNSGDYETAITLYTKAYQLVPHPVLLFNQAQAYRLAGDTDQALALYARYLATDPKGKQAPIARELVAELEARKARQARRARMTPPDDASRTAGTRAPDVGGDEPAGDATTRRHDADDDGPGSGGTLVVHATDAHRAAITGGRVIIDDRRRSAISAGTLSIAGIAEGRHTVVIEAGGYQRFEKTVKIHDGEATELAALLVETPPRSSFWKWSLGASLAIAVGGEAFSVYSYARENSEAAALVVTAAGGGTGSVSSNDCGTAPAELAARRQIMFNFQAFERACAWQTRGSIGFIVGGVGAVAALVSLIMVLRDPEPADVPSTGTRKKPEVAIAPIIMPHGGGASILLAW